MASGRSLGNGRQGDGDDAALASARHGTFALLFREFFSQLFVTESPLTDHQLRQAIIGVFAFVITPGLFLPLMLGGAIELAALQQPALLDAVTRLLATIFLSYSMIVTGVLAAFEWDALAFDRRDALVLGPLPIAGWTVVAAKVSALGALLFIAAAGVNGLTAITFSFAATPHLGIWATGRLFAAHLIATTAASVFVFCTLVTIRSAVGLLGRGRIVVGSLLQFGLVSAILCFLIFAPTAVTLEFPRRGDAVQTMHVRMTPVPVWSPTNGFAALYDELRGAAPVAEAGQAHVAIALVVGSVIAALAATLSGYRYQLRRALDAPISSGMVAARFPRALARLLAGRSRAAQAIADFMVTTLARSRAQQAPVAMNVAIAAVIIVLDLSRSRSAAAAVFHLSALMSPLPLVAAFWAAVGIRASFFVPSELSAAWTFRMNAIDVTSARHSAIRGATTAILVPAAAICSGVLSARLGWLTTIRHASFVALAVTALIALVASTVRFIPYTRPYEPGHAKLKTRWPLYLIGSYAFSYRLAALERACWPHPLWFAALLLGLAAIAMALDAAGRARKEAHSLDALEEFTPGLATIRLS